MTADSTPAVAPSGPPPDVALERYRQMVEESGEAIFTTDAYGVITYVNPAIEQVLEYTPSEVIGHHYLDFIAPFMRDEIAAHYQVQFRQRIPKTTLQVPVWTRSQTVRWVEQTVVLLRNDGRVTGFLGFSRDVTDRRRAEDALAQERNLLRTIIDILPENIFVKDTESRFVLANRAVAQAVGVASPDDLIGTTALDALPARFGQELYDDEQRVIRTGEPLINKEERLVNNAGFERWYLTTKVPLRDSSGAIVGLVGMSHDITQRKQVEAELQAAYDALEQRVAERTRELSHANAILQDQIREREQAERALAEERTTLRVLIDNLPDYIYVKDVEGRFVVGNRTVSELMGAASPPDLVGKTDFDYYPRHLAIRYFADDMAVIQSGKAIVNREEPNIDSQGTTRWVLTTKVPLRDNAGKVVGLVGIGRDISASKQVADVLRQQQEFLHQVIDNDPNLIFVKDAAGRFLISNRAHAELMGVSPEEILGKTDADLGLPDDRIQQYLADDQEVLATGRPKFIAEEAVVSPRTGELRWFQTTKVPVPSPDGQSFNVLGVATDITERKQAEAQAVELALERERVRLLADFIRDASHDFRTPLSTINTSVYLLQRLTDSERLRQHALVIQDQTRHLARLLEGLLTMTRLDSETTFNFRPYNVNELLRIIHARGIPSDSSADVRFSVELDPAFALVRADGVELDRALTELVKNAAQHTPAGGSIRLRSRFQSPYVVIDVIDTGTGIAPDDLPHIFERFYRADKARSAETGGVGLGLCIVQKIVEAHGGRVEVRSAPGEGSTFSVVLPALDDAGVQP